MLTIYGRVVSKHISGGKRIYAKHFETAVVSGFQRLLNPDELPVGPPSANFNAVPPALAPSFFLASAAFFSLSLRAACMACVNPAPRATFMRR